MGEIRIGRISSLNCEAGTARVTYPDRDGAVTGELPLLSGEYRMPAVGDQVLVLHLSGAVETGVVLGRPWSGKNRPPEGGEGLYRKDLSRTPGRAVIRYDDLTGVLEISAPRLVLCGAPLEDILARLDRLESHTHVDSAGGSTGAPVM